MVVPAPSAASAQQPTVIAASDADGRSLYLDACAACHGADGTGSPGALVAFEEELPDFTDCRFASREPDADWVIVAHEGGPVRGFSEMMPAFGDALGEDALARVIRHVRTFCRETAWPRGELNLPRPLATEKAFPEDETVLENEAALGGGAAFAHTLVYEKRYGPTTQLEFGIPFEVRRDAAAAGAAAGWAAGLGDVVLGVKQVLLHGLDPGRIVSAVAEVKFPTGDASRGFGSGAVAFEGFLAAGHVLPADAFVQAQAGAERSARSGAATELFWSGVIGRTWTEGPWGRAWTPMLEAVGRSEGDEPVAWDLLPQLHVTLNTRQHVMITVGPRIPVSGEEREASLALNLLWDWFDGGFFDGW